MSQLENDRQSYIDYIETVSAICEIDVVLKDMERVKTLPLKELDLLSRTVESVYNLHLENKALDEIIKEVDEMGAEYVKKKYLE